MKKSKTEAYEASGFQSKGLVQYSSIILRTQLRAGRSIITYF